jgi:hypothetical protein
VEEVEVGVSSLLLHAPMIKAPNPIKANQKHVFFILSPLKYRKMQDYSYIYVPGMVLRNPEITPHSHNTKQRRNAYGQFFRTAYTYNNLNATLYFSHPVCFVLLL